MVRKFEIGKEYEPYQREYEPIKVLRRTAKMIVVRTKCSQWSMRIREDADGNEFAVDSSVPKAWRDAFTYFA